MYKSILKTEDEFFEYCPCANKVFSLAKSLEDDARWFFDKCYMSYEEDSYSVIFKSYITEEFKDYLLSIHAVKIDDSWQLKVIKKVDNLLSEKP